MIEEKIKSIEEVVGKPGEAFNRKVAAFGGPAVKGVPEMRDDGEAVTPWMDQFGRFITAGYDLSSGSIRCIMENYPLCPMAPEFSALTEPGSTASIDVSFYRDLVVKVILSAIQTNAVWKVEWSPDGDNWDDLKDVDGYTLVTENADKTAIKRYRLTNEGVNGAAANYIRVTFVSEDPSPSTAVLTATAYATGAR